MISVPASHYACVCRYRKGELPDIQITYKDLLDPLQALCERSSLFARLVLGDLFKVCVGLPLPSTTPSLASLPPLLPCSSPRPLLTCFRCSPLPPFSLLPSHPPSLVSVSSFPFPFPMLVPCSPQTLYSQKNKEGLRLAYSEPSRRDISQRLASLLSSPGHDLGFVAALHTCVMNISLSNAILLNNREDPAPPLPAFPVPPRIVGESAIRCGAWRCVCVSVCVCTSVIVYE